MRVSRMDKSLNLVINIKPPHLTAESYHLNLSVSERAQVYIAAQTLQSLPNVSCLTHMDLGLCLERLPNPLYQHRCSYFFHPLPLPPIKFLEPIPMYPRAHPLPQTVDISHLDLVYQAHKRNASD